MSKTKEDLEASKKPCQSPPGSPRTAWESHSQAISPASLKTITWKYIDVQKKPTTTAVEVPKLKVDEVDDVEPPTGEPLAKRNEPSNKYGMSYNLMNAANK